MTPALSIDLITRLVLLLFMSIQLWVIRKLLKASESQWKLIDELHSHIMTLEKRLIDIEVKDRINKLVLNDKLNYDK